MLILMTLSDLEKRIGSVLFKQLERDKRAITIREIAKESHSPDLIVFRAYSLNNIYCDIIALCKVFNVDLFVDPLSTRLPRNLGPRRRYLPYKSSVLVAYSSVLENGCYEFLAAREATPLDIREVSGNRKGKVGNQWKN